MASPLKQLRYRIEWLAIKLMSVTVPLLPRRGILWLANALAFVAFRVDAEGRHTAQANLIAVFGETHTEDIIMKTKTANVDIIPSNIDLSRAEIELMNMLDRERVLKFILTPLKKKYDYILIDCPPSLGILTINALTAADEAIIPVETDYLALRGAGILINKTIKKVKRKLNPSLKIAGILPTMHNERTLHAREVLDMLKEHFPKQVFTTVIKETVKFKESSVDGTSILEYAKNSEAAKAYQHLAEEVMGNG